MPKRDYSNMLCEIGKEGDLELLKVLNSLNCDLNQSNYDGRTVGHMAASYEQLDLLQYLVQETDFNIQARDRREKTALDYVSEEARKELGIKT